MAATAIEGRGRVEPPETTYRNVYEIGRGEGIPALVLRTILIERPAEFPSIRAVRSFFVSPEVARRLVEHARRVHGDCIVPKFDSPSRASRPAGG